MLREFLNLNVFPSARMSLLLKQYKKIHPLIKVRHFLESKYFLLYTFLMFLGCTAPALQDYSDLVP